LKIGFYGNANNYPFMLARALRRLGHDVEFIVLSRDRLNRPEFCYSDINLPYPSWVHDLSHRLRWRNLFPGPLRTRALRILDACDFVILNEEGLSLASELHVPHGALLTGTDLQVFANPAKCTVLLPHFFRKSGLIRSWLRRILGKLVFTPLLVGPQRAGIRTARFVSFAAKGLIPDGDQLLAELGIKDERRLFVYMTDLELVAFAPPPRNKTIRTFCGTRLTWKREPYSDLVDQDYKGSDVMILGLGLFWRETGVRLDIHLVRKGRHVNETLALAAAEGIADQITWHDEMSQTEVLANFRSADIVFEQFDTSFVGMAGMDAMATGRPLIANGRPEFFATLTPEPSPICQARTPREICEQLQRLVGSPAEREQIGKVSRRFVEKYYSSDVVARDIADLAMQTISKNAPLLPVQSSGAGTASPSA
jgi:glycosyltransferase involved in cell wall biosynthesis